MSVDVYIIAPGCCEAHNHQFTYNYSPALREAGFPSWDMLNNHRAECFAVMVGRVLITLQQDKDRYGALIRGDGEWGTIETLIDSLRLLLIDLDKHPSGIIRCS